MSSLTEIVIRQRQKLVEALCKRKSCASRESKKYTMMYLMDMLMLKFEPWLGKYCAVNMLDCKTFCLRGCKVLSLFSAAAEAGAGEH